MKRLLIYLLVLLAAVWVGLLIHKDAGYVLVNYRQWSVETTLWFAVGAWLLSFLFLYFLFRFLHGLLHVSSRFHLWRQKKQLQKARNQTSQGLCELAEGDWRKAEKNLIQAANHSETPLINYLAAARAAHLQHAFARRDQYLQQAHQSTSDSELAVGLTQAQLQLEGKQFEQTLATLRHLQETYPHHALLLKLLGETYLKLQDWPALTQLLPALRKYSLLKPLEYENLSEQAYSGLFSQIQDKEKIELAWSQIPKDLRQQAGIILAYSKALVRDHQEAQAEDILRQYLKKYWDLRIVEQYGLLKGVDPAKQLAAAEGWLKNHPNDAVVLLCLGRLCEQNRLWGKARSYLAASAKLAPRAETYFELARSLEQTGEQVAAIEAYRRGAALVESSFSFKSQ